MRRAFLAPLLAVSLAVLAGCGDDASESGPLVAAADRTAHEESVRMEFAMEVDSTTEGEYRIVGDGAATSDASRSRMTMTVKLAGEKPVRMEVINIRDEFWMRSARLDMPPGKRWMHSVDREVAPRTMTTRELLELMRESGDVEEVGGERVRGRATTHYKAKVSIDDLFERSPEETQARFRERFEQLEGKDFELPIEVWIDGDDLVRRMVIDMEYQSQRVAIRADMLEYGVNVSAAPPAEETVAEEADVPG